ncbi:MAG: RHS repeat-associated core domain-containing protein [Verrucomicrobiales bacterium]|nr:RHS repeat-associated core domain-containing protein [Verrucomicrobiales bacterium]
MPLLHFGNDPGTGTATIGVITGASGSDWFISNGTGGWTNQFGGHSTLVHDTVAREYILTRTNGERKIFHDDNGGLSEAIRGRLKGVENPGGGRASLTYNLDSELESVSWTGSAGGSAEFRYTYYDDIARLGLIETAMLVIDDVAVRRASYDYYELDDDNGPLRTLRNAKVEEPGGVTGDEWLIVTEQWYRYFTETNTNGAWKYGLRLVLGAEGLAQCRAKGIDPGSASDGDLAAFASHQFLYNDEGRVTSESVRGGEADFTFQWLTNSADPDFTDVNTWYRRCIETRPDGSTRRVYTNRGGGTILDIKVEAGANPGKWNDYYVFDSDYRQLEHATSAAVASVTEPADAAGTLTVTLNQNDGLIRVNDFYAADDFPNGEVKGYLKTRGVKVGATGTVEVSSKRTYATRTVGNASIHPVADEFAYPVAGFSDNDAAKTSYTYTWYDDEFSAPTFQVEEKVMTMPTIATSDHGTGNAESVTMRYDRNGFETWTRDARGTITHSEYDEINGAMIKQINDVDTNEAENVPVGWVTPTGGGLNLVTDYENDRRGRLLRRIGPERDTVIDRTSDDPCSEPGHETLTVRTADYTLFLDSIHQTWTARGYVTGYGSANEAWHLEGPVSIDRRNAGDVTVDSIQARAACPCGALAYDSMGDLDSATHLPDRSLWTRWTKTDRDSWGRKLSEKAYFEIPEAGEGFESSNYLLTQFGYDNLNRLDRTVAPDGTITRTVVNRLDDITADWVGTDDTGATPSDPGNGGNDGNNLVVVRSMEYDGGNSGGNGLLTKLSLPVDGTPANDRITTYTYDGRDRKTQTTTNDGTRDFIEVFAYDNLNQEISRTRYHSNVADTNRIGREESEFDLRGRIYENLRYGADPANGNLKGPLTLGLWYDPNGNVISETAAGSDSATKTDYDGLNRIVTRYQVIPGTVPGGAPANDVTNDVVVEQDELAYDGENNPIFSTHRQRLHDATGTGALGTVSGGQPKARVSFRATYFDAIDRDRFEANFGTNGGADLQRPTDVPSRSATVLVSETRYAKDGQPGTQLDREGVKTLTRRDKLNRVIATVEAAGTDAERTTRYRWHSSGQLGSLILENPDTGEQVTNWSYGATRPESKVARNDLPIRKTYPTGESESQTWNRQSQQLEFTDCNGTVHEYTYDKVGNLLRDAVTTLATGIDGAVQRLEFPFNNQGLLSSAGSWSDPAAGSGTLVNEVEFAYDAFGNVASDAQEHSGAVDGNTPTVSYQRTDGSNNLYRQTGITYPSGAVQEFAYGTAGSIDDAFNRAASLKVTGESTNLVEYEFAGLGRVVTLDYAGSDAKLSYLKPAGFVGTGDAGDDMTGYDRFGRTVAMPWVKRSDDSALATISYGYDAMSRRTFRGDATPAADGEFDQRFEYDPLGQVISRTRGTLNDSRSNVGGIPGEAESWRYDEQGNWLGYDLGEEGASVVEQSRTHNQSNQIVSVDGSGADAEYDSNGNMTLVPSGRGLEGEPKKVTWDAWNRISGIRKENDDFVADYRYDALFRRVTRQLPDAPLRHTYYNENWRPVEEQRIGNDDPVKLWWWGDRHRDDLARRDQDTSGDGTMDEKLWCLMDYFDPIAIVDSSGAVQERYSYSAFGVSRIAAADYSDRNLSSFDWEFRFHGQFEDIETGWMNYGYRYFVPEMGRWGSKDPIGVKGGINIYLYTNNTPINRNDHLGLKPAMPDPVNFQGFCDIEVECGCSDASDGCDHHDEITGSVAGGKTRQQMQTRAEAEAETAASEWCNEKDSSDCNCPDATCTVASSSITRCMELPSKEDEFMEILEDFLEDVPEILPLGDPEILPPNLPPPGAVPQ